ncbi:hypothetical protein [Methanolapillus ohkumae]|uniref:Uncharacterized protein n=1 Tax=Methanolapillus ohkumae TaxID=3028298 RepID=A0AA96ZY25_9EURY|nr:hypothetical protein MsAm2_15020 [Methanosarcinaceae archaeon Am2]
MRHKFFFFRFLKNRSGVSAVFGALLLLGILAVAISLITANVLPARALLEEEKEEKIFFSSVLLFAEKINLLMKKSISFTGQSDFVSETQIIVSKNTSVFADENAGYFFVRTNATLPPNSVFMIADSNEHSFLEADFLPKKNKNGNEIRDGNENKDENENKNENENKDENENEKKFEVLTLSHGSVLFSKKYEQLPDQMYFYGPSSCVLGQKNGAVFVSSPSISVRRGENNQTMFTFSGQIFKSRMPPVEAEQKNLRFYVTKTATVRDRVNLLEIQYKPETSIFEKDAEYYENHNQLLENWMISFSEQLKTDFPAWEIQYDSEKRTIRIESDTTFEMEMTVSEIEIEWGGG